MFERFTGVAEYLRDFVPTEYLPEVVSVLKPHFTVYDLVGMSDEDLLQIVIMLEGRLTFKMRFLFRYLQAASLIHRKSYAL